MDYTHLIEEVEQELHEEKEFQVKKSLRVKMKALTKAVEKKEILEKEVKMLAKKGKLENLEDHIKISEGVNVDSSSHILLGGDGGDEGSTIGIAINKETYY